MHYPGPPTAPVTDPPAAGRTVSRSHACTETPPLPRTRGEARAPAHPYARARTRTRICASAPAPLHAHAPARAPAPGREHPSAPEMHTLAYRAPGFSPPRQRAHLHRCLQHWPLGCSTHFRGGAATPPRSESMPGAALLGRAPGSCTQKVCIGAAPAAPAPGGRAGQRRGPWRWLRPQQPAPARRAARDGPARVRLLHTPAAAPV